jgi:hypothetical protein
MVRLRNSIFCQELGSEHRQWFSAFDPRYLRVWKNLLKYDEEAAFAEARVRHLLQGNGVVVEPNEDLETGNARPDFRCHLGINIFYVEVTCIRVGTAIKAGYPTSPQPDGLYWSNTREPISRKCQKKQKQCFNLDAPVLVAIGTFNSWMALDFFDKCVANQVLIHLRNGTGRPDVRTGCQVAESCSTWELESTNCLNAIDDIRSRYDQMSGLLLCGLSLSDHKMIGVLNSNPVCPFDPKLLPEVEFLGVSQSRKRAANFESIGPR